MLDKSQLSETSVETLLKLAVPRPTPVGIQDAGLWHSIVGHLPQEFHHLVGADTILILNKMDLPSPQSYVMGGLSPNPPQGPLSVWGICPVSCASHLSSPEDGMDGLLSCLEGALREKLHLGMHSTTTVISRERHRYHLQECSKYLEEYGGE